MGKLSDSEIEQARSNIHGVVTSFGVDLTPHGKEYRALCPFHSEKSASFTVVPSKEMYCCFGCGSRGSAIDFVMNIANTDFRSAVQLINNGDIPSIAPIKHESESVEEWKQVTTVPNDAPLPMDTLHQRIDGKWVKLHSSRNWAYRNADGSLYGYVHRFDLPDGGKITAPQTWCKNKNGEFSWKWKALAKPRPVFGLDLLAANPLANVLIVEGEKTAIAARTLTDMIVVTWCGGANATKFTEWDPLKGRKVYLWPDADQKNNKDGGRIPFMDQPGVSAMLSIYEILGKPDDTYLIVPPCDVPDGWDLADELPDNFDFTDCIHNAISLSEVNVHHEKEEKKTAKRRTKAEIHDSNERADLKDNPHFKHLGYDRGIYYFFQHEKGQVITNTKGDLSESGLIELAPLDWWEGMFNGAKSGMNRPMALNWMMRKSNSRGIYDVSKVRGRGAWTDKGRMVFHHGDALTVNQDRQEIDEFSSTYVYEMRKKLPDLPDEILSDEDGAFLLSTAREFRWNMPASGPLLMGWIALAPVCGALGWRPHVWINGMAGSGKSSLLENFVHPLLNGTDLYVQGNSSEAGIRQELLGDALPVIFDESESNTEKDSSRIQSILSLIRQSSSESEAKTLKGTSAGSAMAFHIRSMFCLASIQVGLKQQPDMERVTILNLRSAKDDPDAQQKWSGIKDAFYKIRKDHSMAGRLVKRSISLLDVTIDNIHTFSTAAAKKFGNQRDGDQYGALMAGAWSVVAQTRISEEDALKYMNQYQWGDYREYRDNDAGQRALMTLMGSMIRANQIDVTVSELVMRACNRLVGGVNIKSEDAMAVLERYGMKIENDKELIICNNHPNLSELMSGTAFSADFRSVLLSYQGAKKLDKTYRFNGMVSRAYSVPLNEILGNDIKESF